MFSFEERLHYHEYVTPKLTRQTPIYNWYTFPHSFARELVHELLDEFKVGKEDTIFDPFVGAGTTLLACRERGIPAFGIDQLPFSVFVSNVKLRNYNPDDLQNLLENIPPLIFKEQVFGSVPIVDRAFSDDAKRVISAIYTWTQKLPREAADFFTLALLNILENASRTTKSGGWLRLVDAYVNPDNVDNLFTDQAQEMINNIRELKLPFNEGLWYAMLGDARDQPGSARRAKYVISSPPYLNRHDYTRVFALEMALHFVDSNEELIAVRRTAFRSHVEAKEQPDYGCEGYEIPTSLKIRVSEFETKVKKHDRHRVPSMIKGYFEDIFSTLTSLYKRIEWGGKIAFVLGNVRFSGVMIPVDEIVAEIGEQVGLKVDKIIIARYRGNSAQQMAEYGRSPARESIIIWEKKA